MKTKPKPKNFILLKTLLISQKIVEIFNFSDTPIHDAENSSFVEIMDQSGSSVRVALAVFASFFNTISCMNHHTLT